MTSKTATEEYLRKTNLPAETESYTVIPHGIIIDEIRDRLERNGFIVTSELYKSECNGDVALGFMKIENGADPDMAMTFNWSNSYNKQVRFSCSIGGFIYDNQVPFASSTNSASWNRKHTGTALTETVDIITAMIESANDHFDTIIEMKERFKATEVSRKEYAKLMGLLYFDKNVITSEQVNIIKREYDKPSFKYSDPGTLWEVYKMIMLGIVDQSPKKWYSQQMIIHDYIQVLFNVAKDKVEEEELVLELSEEFSSQEKREEVAHVLDLLINAEEEGDVFITDEEEDELIEAAFIKIERAELKSELIALEDENEDEVIIVEEQELLFNDDDDNVNILDSVEESVVIETAGSDFDIDKEIIIEDVVMPYQGIGATDEPSFSDIIGEEIINKSNEEIQEALDVLSEKEDSFEIIDEQDDESIDEVPWFTEGKGEEAPVLILDSMRDEVSNILETRYEGNRTIVNSTEIEDSVVFELDSFEFFLVEK